VVIFACKARSLPKRGRCSIKNFTQLKRPVRGKNSLFAHLLVTKKFFGRIQHQASSHINKYRFRESSAPLTALKFTPRWIRIVAVSKIDVP
jgi:hypothetical protein